MSENRPGGMCRLLAVAAASMTAALVQPLAAAPWVFPDPSWIVKTPEDLGVNRGKLDTFRNKVGGSGVVIKDGYMIYSWGNISERHNWYSASKPVLSTLLFFAVNEHRIAGVDSLIGDWRWPLRTEDQNMTFRQLADMTSGYARAEGPGERWAYNDYAIQLYVDTLERIYGAPDLSAPSEARLKSPLQFQGGSCLVGTGRANISPSDFARIGWFWMNKGNWKGKQLLPASFFDNYVKADVPSTMLETSAASDDYLGVGSYGGGSDQTNIGPGIYGFNWWFNTNRDSPQLTWPAAPADTYQANGRWGTEAMTMFPSLGMVVAAYGGNGWGGFTPGDANSSMNQSLKLLVDAVPEPASVALLGLGGLALVLRRRR